MNKQQKANLANLVNQIEGIAEQIDAIKDEEQGKLDGLPENMQDGDRASGYQETIDALEPIVEALNDQAVALGDVE